MKEQEGKKSSFTGHYRHTYLYDSFISFTTISKDSLMIIVPHGLKYQMFCENVENQITNSLKLYIRLVDPLVQFLRLNPSRQDSQV